MKITFTGIKHALGIALATGTLAAAGPLAHAQSNNDTLTLKKDTVEFSMKIPPAGTTSDTVLFGAPSPEIEVCGKKRNAAIVVDLSKNVLYKYNEKGDAECAYLVASGKKSTPTDTGLRVVTHVESFPYKTAPASTKRRRQPWNYGPKIIILEKLDSKTGARDKTGEFIHGNNNPKSLGKYASLGCIRMDNEVIKKLSKQVHAGDLVLIKR